MFFFAYKNEDTGFTANLFENAKTKVLVIAYRGTERLGLGENTTDINALMKDVMTDINLMTGNFDKQFNDAKEFYEIVKSQNPKNKIVMVGQSLGGALAQIVAAKEYTIHHVKIETYTFNAPGCSHLLEVYGCNTRYSYSFITNYSVMNDWCGMFGNHIGKRYLISPIPINAIESNTLADILNNILLTTHEGIFDYSKETMGKVIRKPKDFNQNEGLSLWYFDENNPLRKYKNVSNFLDFNTSRGMDNTISSKIKNEADNTENNEHSFLNVQNNSFIEKAEKSIEQVQNSNIATAIKNATDNFMQTQSENINNWFNSNTFGVVTKVFDSVFSELTPISLEKAKAILKREIKR